MMMMMILLLSLWLLLLMMWYFFLGRARLSLLMGQSHRAMQETFMVMRGVLMQCSVASAAPRRRSGAQGKVPEEFAAQRPTTPYLWAVVLCSTNCSVPSTMLSVTTRKPSPC